MTQHSSPVMDEDESDETALALSDQAVAVFEPLLAMIPEAGGDGAGYETILRQLAQAQDASELDAPWRAGGLQLYQDTSLVITDIRRMPSDYQGGLGWFLVVDAVVKGTGERIAVTTGSVGVVAQLVKAYALGALPLTVIPRRSKKASKAGFYAWHLEMAR